jgi:hypothetical protein
VSTTPDIVVGSAANSRIAADLNVEPGVAGVPYLRQPPTSYNHHGREGRWLPMTLVDRDVAVEADSASSLDGAYTRLDGASR